MRRGWWLLVAVVLAGCTDDDPPTAAPSASTSTTSTSGTSTTAESTTTTLVPASVPPGPDTRVVASSLGVLGWWDGQGWVRYAAGVPVPVLGGEEYQVVRLDEPVRSTIGSPLGRGCSEISFDGNPAVDLDLGPEPTWPTRLSPVAVSGVEDPRPRLVSLLAPDAYRAPAREVVGDVGFEPDGSEVVQVVRSDLDGDGTDEVVVVAERHRDPSTGPLSASAGPGDHSVAFLRIAGDGDVRTEVLAMEENDSTPEMPSPYLLLSRVAAIADLNGDGRMEVVLAQHYYEGSTMVVFELAVDGSVDEVLSIGCGA